MRLEVIPLALKIACAWHLSPCLPNGSRPPPRTEDSTPT